MRIFSLMLMYVLCTTVMADDIVITNKYNNATQAFFIMNDKPAMIIGYSCDTKICLYSVRSINNVGDLVLIEHVREYELYLPSDNKIIINNP